MVNEVRVLTPFLSFLLSLCISSYLVVDNLLVDLMNDLMFCYKVMSCNDHVVSNDYNN